MNRISLLAMLIFMLPVSCAQRQTKGNTSLKLKTIEVEDFVKHTNATDNETGLNYAVSFTFPVEYSDKTVLEKLQKNIIHHTLGEKYASFPPEKAVDAYIDDLKTEYSQEIRERRIEASGCYKGIANAIDFLSDERLQLIVTHEEQWTGSRYFETSDTTVFNLQTGEKYNDDDRQNLSDFRENNPGVFTEDADRQAFYYIWTCQQGEHAGATIVFARMGDVFRGEYVDPDFQDYFSIPVMGMIDSEGNVAGVSAVTSAGGIRGKLNGTITGDKFHAFWLPAPEMMELSEFREMEMTKKELSVEMKKEMDNHPDAFYNILYPEKTFVMYDSETSAAGKEKNRVIPFRAKTPFTEVAYGYAIGEWEQKHIHIGKGAKNNEVEFYLHIAESAKDDIDVTIQGFALLNGNIFRYNEAGYEFEVAVYNGFITVKTISGDLNGVKADGVYPALLEMSLYVN
jgi:hypothetical protein